MSDEVGRILAEMEMGYKLEDGDYPDLIDRTECRRPTDSEVLALMVPELRTMPYPEFLQTPYWRIVRARVLGHDEHPWYRRCERCQTRQASEAHHRTYAHRGREWLYLQDLEALCVLCHAAEHRKPTDRVPAYGLPDAEVAALRAEP
jgi:hypothetical protein